MKKLILLLPLVLLFSWSYAQLTKAEIDAYMKRAQKMTDSIMKQAKSSGYPDKTIPASFPGGLDSKPITDQKFPAKKTALLASLPKRILSKQELMSSMAALHAELERKLPAVKVAAAQAIILKLNKNASKIADAGVVGWYKNAPAEAALLLTYAASQSPDDNTLNNCGAVLNLCGLEQKAIPVLKYALVNEPNNSTLLNNLGQAYAGLGATDSAMVYLMGCIRQCDTHPQACATAAYIENKKGNTDKAVQLVEKAIKGGGYSDGLFDFYKSIKKDALLAPLLDKNLSGEKYFKLNGFEIAPNCRNWQECETVSAKQEAFKKKIEALRQQFGGMIRQNNPTNVSTAQGFLKWASDKNWKRGPVGKVAFELRSELWGLHFKERTAGLFEFTDKFTKLGMNEEAPERNAFNEKYDALFKNAKGDRIRQLLEQQCKERVQIDNKYFDKRTNLVEKYKHDLQERDIKFYNDIIFLDVLIDENDALFKSDCAAAALELVTEFSTYSLITCYPSSKPDCSQYDPKKDAGNNNSPEFNVSKCPINIEVPFGIGKINLDCTSFKIEAGEGIIFNFEKNFVTRESTIAVGVGVSAHVPGIQTLEFGAKEQLFIKFDKDNQPCDLGASWEAELDIKGVGSPEIKTGYTVGINSGWNFEPGALKVIIPQL
jgi:tetratricopeptide (TPR) repeat protein